MRKISERAVLQSPCTIPQNFLPVVKKFLGTHDYCTPCFRCGVPRAGVGQLIPKRWETVSSAGSEAGSWHRACLSHMPTHTSIISEGHLERKCDCNLRSLLSLNPPHLHCSHWPLLPKLSITQGVLWTTLVPSVFSLGKKDSWSEEFRQCCTPSAPRGESQCARPYESPWEALQKRSTFNFVNPEFPQLCKNRTPFPSGFCRKTLLKFLF